MNKLTVTVDEVSFDVEITPSRTAAGEYVVTVAGESLSVFVPDHDQPDNVDWMIVDNRPYEMVFAPDLRSVQLEGGRHAIFVRDHETHTVRPLSGDGRVKAPIPGLINRLYVEPGSAVEANQSLLVLEAMKMENEIRAPRAGTVRQVNVKPGQTVVLNEVLVEIE
jgi:biotin carboxyl carrier protein